MWKKISSKTILIHPRLEVIEDEIRLPNGKHTDYLKFASTGSAAGIICHIGDKFLVQKEYSYVPNKEIIQFPGGFVPKGEDLVAGVNRELMEESGYRATNPELIGSFMMNHRRSKTIGYLFYANHIENKKIPGDETENIKNIWLTKDQIDNLILKEKSLSVEFIASWCLFKSKKNLKQMLI